MSDWNQRVIEEFRANGGVVGGTFEGKPLLLLHHRGARSGTWRVSPLACYPVDERRWAIFASRGGAPTNPDWYHNLMAHPDVRIEVGSETVDVTATEVTGEERQRIFDAHAATWPIFAEYAATTERTIPVIVLEPR
jgi:deazaflavin-dependent oxidoreductase (nitroreductase family)